MGASKRAADAAQASMAGDREEEDEDDDSSDADDTEEEEEESLPYTDTDGVPRPREYDLPDGFACTAVCHPDTYLNKILLGGSDGRLLLLNVSTGRNVHVFSPEVREKAASYPFPAPTPLLYVYLCKSVPCWCCSRRKGDVTIIFSIQMVGA